MAVCVAGAASAVTAFILICVRSRFYYEAAQASLAPKTRT